MRAGEKFFATVKRRSTKATMSQFTSTSMDFACTCTVVFCAGRCETFQPARSLDSSAGHRRGQRLYLQRLSVGPGSRTTLSNLDLSEQ